MILFLPILTNRLEENMSRFGINFGRYDLSYEEFEKNAWVSRQEFYRNPSGVYCKPFCIAGNLYYVGDKRVCAHLIDTGEGLILFDAGFQHTIHLLVQSIWELGFNPADVKYLILSHGHFDHFGACNEFRALYGCKTFMSKADAQMHRTNPAGGLLDMNPNPYAQLPVIDHEFCDQEIIRLGNTSIRCVLTPGHSPGTTTFFFDIKNGDQMYHVGYFGGVGFLTLYKAFLKKYGLNMTLRDEFVRSIEKVKGEQVDIVLGNHPSQNGTLEKRQYMLEHPGENPFIDPSEWDEFLTKLSAQYQSFMQRGF